MTILSGLADRLQTLLGELAQSNAELFELIKRERKFTGISLSRMLVLTVLEHPRPELADFANASGRLGLPVSEAAVAKRFTEALTMFLHHTFGQALAMLLSDDTRTETVLNKFSRVLLVDSTNLPLPESLAQEYPIPGTPGEAALKIQFLMDLKSQQIIRMLFEGARAADARTPLVHQLAQPGDLIIADLGYFCIDRFARVHEEKAFFISRFQHNTKLFDASGSEFDLRGRLASHTESVLDVPILLGAQQKLPCRLIAVRVPQEVAARGRQEATRKAREHGRQPTDEYLELLGWNIFVTNCPSGTLTWKETIVLYRARWQIELTFKLFKSHNGLASYRANASAREIKASLWAKLIGILIQHWLSLSAKGRLAARSMDKAAKIIRDWIATIIDSLDRRELLMEKLSGLADQLAQRARVRPNTDNPSHYQLLGDPESLDWGDHHA